MNITQLRAPDWRWQQARAYIDAQSSGQSVQNPDDPLVLYVIRMLKATKTKGSKIFAKAKMPELYDVITLGSNSHDSAMRARLQIAILTSQTDQQVLKYVQWMTPVQLRFYRDVFFDVHQFKHIAQWMQDHVFSSVRSNATRRVHRSRKLAVLVGAQAALKSVGWGQLPQKSRDALLHIFKSQRIKQLADYCITQQQVDATTLATIMHSTYTKMQDRQLQRQLRSQAGAQDKSMLQLTSNIEQSLRTYTQQQRDAAALTGTDDTKEVIDRLKNRDL